MFSGEEKIDSRSRTSVVSVWRGSRLKSAPAEAKDIPTIKYARDADAKFGMAGQHLGDMGHGRLTPHRAWIVRMSL
jgi:hypothetical protein